MVRAPVLSIREEQLRAILCLVSRQLKTLLLLFSYRRPASFCFPLRARHPGDLSPSCCDDLPTTRVTPPPTALPTKRVPPHNTEHSLPPSSQPLFSLTVTISGVTFTAATITNTAMERSLTPSHLVPSSLPCRQPFFFPFLSFSSLLILSLHLVLTRTNFHSAVLSVINIERHTTAHPATCA